MNRERANQADDRRVVLIVDDEEALLRSYSRLLAPTGLKILVASNALEALDILGRTRVNLVVADHRLGRGPSGLDLLATIARRWPEVGRILITAALDASLALAAKGHHRVIPKDLSWTLISTIITIEANRER